MRLYDLKISLIYLILELNLKYCNMHLCWKFHEAESKSENVMGFPIIEIMMKYENKALWFQNEANLSHLTTQPQI